MKTRDDERYRKRISKIKAYFAERSAHAGVIPLLDALADERSLASARRLMQEFFSGHDPHDLESLRRVTSAFAHKSVVRDIVADILSNNEYLEEIAARSYPHPIGFDKLVLWQNADGAKMRLHVYWRSPQELKTELIHLHKFLMASAPATGEIDNRIYHVTYAYGWPSPIPTKKRGKGEEKKVHAYTGYERDEKGRLHKRFICDVTLEDKGKKTYIPGQTYAQSLSDAHYVETNAETGHVNNDVCSTVYVHGASLEDGERKVPVVFEEEKLSDDDAIIPMIPNFTVERLRGSLVRYKDILDESVRFYDWVYDPKHGPNLSIGLIAGYLLAENFGTQEVLKKWVEDNGACRRLLRFHSETLRKIIFSSALGGVGDMLAEMGREGRYFSQLLHKAKRHPGGQFRWFGVYGDLEEQFARYAKSLIEDYAKGILLKTLKPVWGLQTLNVRGGVHWGNIRALLHVANWVKPMICSAFREGAIASIETPSGPTTRWDRKVQDIMEKELAKDFPDVGFVGEEGGRSEHEPSEGDCRWLVDPIDGSRNFIAGSRNFAVAGVHQEYDGMRWATTDAVVSLPAHEETYWAERGEGAFWIENGMQKKLLPGTIPERTIRESILEIPTIRGFGALEFPLRETIDALGIRTRSTGCTALSLCQVASGQSQGCIVTANDYDVAAGLLIAEESGAEITSISFVQDQRSVTVHIVCRSKKMLTELQQIVHDLL